MAENINLRVPVFNFDTGEFEIGISGAVKTVVGSAAVGQIVLKAELTDRGVYPIYGDYENPENNHIYGSDAKAVGICGDFPKDVRISEISRAAREAIYYDPWVVSVDSVTVREGVDGNKRPCFIVDIEFTDIFKNAVLVEGVEV